MQKIATLSYGWFILTIVLCLNGIGTHSQKAVFTAQDGQNLSVTSRADDYVIQNQRQYAAVILKMESDLAAYEANYQNQLSVIQTQSAMVEAKINELNAYLLPLEMRDDLSKHCVQKYKERISSTTTVRTSIAACVATANNAYSSVIADARNTKTNLNNWYNNQFITLINDCKKKFVNAQLNYTICVTQAVATADSVTLTYQKNFNTYLQQSTCSGDGKVRAAVDCSFVIIDRTISTASEIKFRVNNCAEGNEYCPPCPTPDNNNQTCPNEIYLSLSPGDFRNATIENPFQGYNTSVPCVYVNFEKRGLLRRVLNKRK